MKPIKYFNKRSSNIVLYREWFDEFGATLNINKKKQIKINLHDLTLDVNNIPCTDIYFGLNIKNIIKISEMAYIQYGSCNETNNKIYCISLLGVDNYFRTYIYYDKLQKVSPLIVGIDTLKIIANSLDIIYPLDIISSSIPMTNSKQYFVRLPLDKNFISEINKENENLANLFL